MPSKDSSSTSEDTWDFSPREVVRKLQFLCATHHVTVQQLAERTGVPKKNVQDILDGVALPTEAMLHKCAEFFGVSIDFVMGREDAGGKRTVPARRSPSSKSSGSAGRTTAKARGTSKRPSSGLNVRTIATRHQALVELLIEKGVITARDYHEVVQKVEGRGK